MPLQHEAQTAPDTAAPAVKRFTDFDQLAGFFRRWQGRFEQLSIGRFEGALQLVRGTHVRVVSVEFNQVILARGESGPGLFSVYLVSPRNAGGLWQGRRLHPGQLVAHGPDAGTDHRSARHCATLGVSLPVEALERAARVLQARTMQPAPRSWAALTPPPHVSDALEGQLRRLLHLGTPGLVTLEGRQVEQACIRAVVAAVLPTAEQHQVDLSFPARCALVRRAEQLMRAQLQEPVGAIDLCSELGVSDRTLRLAFRERYGLGPMVYYKTLRLNAVRSGLKAEPEGTVAEVALRYGFHHLSHFAADYRRAFGELPSRTLARG